MERLRERDLHPVIEALERSHGIRAAAGEARPVGGGCINQVFRLGTEGGLVLLKVNVLEQRDAFEAEADGLAALADAAREGGVAVPEVLGYGSAGPHAYLVLEWLELGRKTASAETRLGRRLARQHRVAGQAFGWRRDNWLGETAQPNPPTADWLEFLRDARLGFQLQLAARNGLPGRCGALGERLLERLEVFFDGFRPPRSLLHGDLWGGNWGAGAHGTPYVFDPAVYYGDREADLAMTRLFGGFGQAFYEAYAGEWPLPHGWEKRVDLYNLYHLLNHFNIFGGGYLMQVESTLERLNRDS